MGHRVKPGEDKFWDTVEAYEYRFVTGRASG
jgi:hypothetical protein